MSAPTLFCKHLQRLNFKRFITQFDRLIISRCIYITKKSTQAESSTFYDETDEEELDKIRDVSRLRPGLRKRLAHVHTMPDTWTEYMQSRQFQRRMYARFGSSSGINPGIMWPSKTEMKEMTEDDAEFDQPLHVMIDVLQTKKRNEEEIKLKKQERVQQNMAKMDTWIEEYKNRKIQKQEEQLMHEKKKLLAVEEAREFFGYYISPDDDKFKEMMEVKERQEKKEAKLRKRQQRLVKMTEKLQASAEEL